MNDLPSYCYRYLLSMFSVCYSDCLVTLLLFSEQNYVMINPVLLAGLAALYLPALGRRGFKCSPGNSKSICLPDTYSKFELPNTEKTNKIDISIDIDEVLRINDGTYSITFSTYFNVEWNERRLNVGPEFGASLRWGGKWDSTLRLRQLLDSGLTTPLNPSWSPWI